jgi:antitoxin component YwqK of YwqJK toxin-antitoxin module
MKDGEHIKYYPSGVISSKRNYIDDKRNGECIYYYLSGKVFNQSSYLDDELHGEWIYYSKSGVELSSKHYYINGFIVTESKWLCYSRDIKLESIL